MNFIAAVFVHGCGLRLPYRTTVVAWFSTPQLDVFNLLTTFNCFSQYSRREGVGVSLDGTGNMLPEHATDDFDYSRFPLP